MQKDELSGSKLYEVKKRSEVKFYLNLLKKKMWIVGVFGIYLSILLFLSLLSQLTYSLGISELTDILQIVVQVLGWCLIPFIIFWMVYVILFLWKSTVDILKYQFGGFRGDGI
jgi:Na+/H+-dicarboxylate symporter